MRHKRVTLAINVYGLPNIYTFTRYNRVLCFIKAKKFISTPAYVHFITVSKRPSKYINNQSTKSSGMLRHHIHWLR
jgi:hypothetical protein